MIFKLLKYFRFYGGNHACNICDRPVRKFFPFSTSLQQSAKSAGFQYDFRRMETLNVDACNCPFCLSSDRERLYFLFLSSILRSSDNNQLKVLDFAPTESFSKAVKGYKSINYTSADFYRTDVDIQIDICDMQALESNQFDIIICSHILEHVANPEKALSELLRVTKPGGFAIIMVPLFWDVLETIENPAYNNEELRNRYYGQGDHVRLFAKQDFINRITQAGFKIEALDPSSFNIDELNKYSIADNSVLYVCHK